MLDRLPFLVAEALQGVRVVQVFASGKASGLIGQPGRGAVVDALEGKVSATGVVIGIDECL